MRRIGLAVVLAVVVIGAIATPVLAVKDETVLVSRPTSVDDGTGAVDRSDTASVSADGRYVAFESDANNLSAVDDDAATNVFVRDLVAGTTTLVSRRSAADGGAAGTGGASYDAALSADGRYVAFQSDADNLSTLDDNLYTNVFVRDLAARTTTLVSRQSAADGAAGANDRSFDASLSADGRHVAFQSDADNLSSADNNSYTSVFVRDLVANTTTLVSRQSVADGGAAADGSSTDPAVSADGRHVAFRTDADNLSSADNNSYLNVFVRDLVANTTTLVNRQSAADGGAGGDGSSYNPSVSADGRYVAFESNADNLSSVDNNSPYNIFVRDLAANTTTLASRQSTTDGGATDGDSYDPSVSSDGRYVAFSSGADNLSGADNNTYVNVFVRDLVAATTTLASRQSASDGGGGGDNDSESASVSADGRYVVFDSLADNLSALDDDAYSNVFVRDVLGPPAALVPPQVPAPPGPTTTTKSTGPALTVARVFTLPSGRSCLKRPPRLKLRYRSPTGITIERVEARIARKRLALRTGAKARRSLTLTKLPAGAFTLTITITPRGGRAVSAKRAYTVCKKARKPN